MKKLIIIGNGFDLAHGYPTSYRDFMKWLVKSEFIHFWKKSNIGRVDLPLFSCSIGRRIDDLENVLNDSLMLTLLKSLKSSNHHILGVTTSQSVRRKNKDNHTNPVSLRASTDFGKTLLVNSYESWVDIEQTYYDHLRIILTQVQNKSNANKLEAVNLLNTQLAYLCNKLKEYLLTIKTDRQIESYESLFTAPIDTKKLFKSVKIRTAHNQDNVGYKSYILNFNYTNTVATYIDNAQIPINQIHGSICEADNPMIFGYGDELDSDFQTMENENVSGFLTHIKSLWYLRTTNYHDLLRFIESDYYQVQIFGHSCGRSDRTLLNMIFEHENCNSIKIFYRKRKDGTDNFNEIAEEISRQFKDKQKLRRRVLPKDPENVLPQYDDEVSPALDIIM